MADHVDLDEYRAGAEEYLQAPGPAADARHAALFTAERVSALTALAETGGPRARNLARYAAEGHLRLASAAEMARLQEELRAPMAGGLTLLDVDAALAAEPSADRRRELQAERLRAIGARLPSAVSDVEVRRTMAAHELGAATAAELIARAAGLDLRATAAVGAAVLDAGDDTVGRTLDGIDSADLPRVLRAPDLADALPAAGARAALERTCELLGTAAPAVAPSTAGWPEYAEALRLGGLALASAGGVGAVAGRCTSPRRPGARPGHGDPLEGLLTEPAWLVRVLDAADPGRVTGPGGDAPAGRRRSPPPRRAAAQGGGDREELMSRALGVQWPRELSLLDGLAGPPPPDAIRARALAGVLRRHLRETSGDRWFADPRSGTFLREIWLEAGDLTPEALARRPGGRGPHRRPSSTRRADLLGLAASCCAGGAAAGDGRVRDGVVADVPRRAVRRLPGGLGRGAGLRGRAGQRLRGGGGRPGPGRPRGGRRRPAARRGHRVLPHAGQPPGRRLPPGRGRPGTRPGAGGGGPRRSACTWRDPSWTPARHGAHDPRGPARPRSRRPRRPARRSPPRDRHARAGAARGPGRVARIARAGAIAAVGHTEADAAEARAAIDAGARLLTHAMNAMPGLAAPRASAPSAAFLVDPRPHVSLIADGVHLDDDSAFICTRTAGARAILISDAVAAAGAPPGRYRLGRRTITSDGVRATSRGRLAGAVAGLDAGPRTLVRAGLPVAVALAAATAAPRRLLGLPAGLAPGDRPTWSCSTTVSSRASPWSAGAWPLPTRTCLSSSRAARPPSPSAAPARAGRRRRPAASCASPGGSPTRRTP